jgi:hypothetical protein
MYPVIEGAFSLKKRHATEWRLTEFPCDITHALMGSKEFMRWQAPAAAEIERRRIEAKRTGSRSALPSGARAHPIGQQAGNVTRLHPTPGKLVVSLS